MKTTRTRRDYVRNSLLFFVAFVVTFTTMFFILRAAMEPAPVNSSCAKALQQSDKIFGEYDEQDSLIRLSAKNVVTGRLDAGIAQADQANAIANQISSDLLVYAAFRVLCAGAPGAST